MEKRSESPVIFILADALRHDYPVMHGMSFLKDADLIKVEPSTGFCEIVEYVSGKKADEHGMLCQVTAKSEWQSVRSNRVLTWLDTLVRFVRPIPKVRGLVNIIANLLLRGSVDEQILRVRYNIPLNLLNYFRPTESRTRYTDESFGQGSNILVDLLKKGSSIDLEGFVEFNKIQGTDDSRVDSLTRKVTTKSLSSFTMVYLGYSEMAHFWGSASSKFSDLMKHFDHKLKELKESLDRCYGDYDLVIVGDHGMVDVDRYIDIQKKVTSLARSLGLVIERDYIFFIDSTMFRLWFNNSVLDDKRELLDSGIRTFLDNCLDELVPADYLNNFTGEYGDIIYLLKPGLVFYPDFFSDFPNTGMHGYRGDISDQLGSFFYVKNGDWALPYEKKTIKLAEVYDLLKQLVS